MHTIIVRAPRTFSIKRPLQLSVSNQGKYGRISRDLFFFFPTKTNCSRFRPIFSSTFGHRLLVCLSSLQYLTSALFSFSFNKYPYKNHGSYPAIISLFLLIPTTTAQH